jgi:hypothetical protein
MAKPPNQGPGQGHPPHPEHPPHPDVPPPARRAKLPEKGRRARARHPTIVR